MPDQAITERRLELAAESRAASLGFSFSKKSLRHLQKFVRAGVARMEEDPLLEDETRLALAEAHIVVFVTQMVIEAQKLNYPQLREDTFFAAMKSLCPLWPFC